MILTLRLKEVTAVYLGPGKEMAAATVKPKFDTGIHGSRNRQQEMR